MIAQLKTQLKTERWALLPSDTPIQPLLIGSNAAVMQVAQALRVAGVLVPAIRPPTVQKGQARLRISLSAAHTQDDVQRLCDVLNGLP